MLIARGVAFPYVHDLARLLTLVQTAGEPVPPSVAEAARLTRDAITTRYPNLTEPVTAEDHRQAVALAEAVVKWAEERVREGVARPVPPTEDAE